MSKEKRKMSNEQGAVSREENWVIWWVFLGGYSGLCG